jgi:hypothetical protein
MNDGIMNHNIILFRYDQETSASNVILFYLFGRCAFLRGARQHEPAAPMLRVTAANISAGRIGFIIVS